jgi:hypothetical protein
VVACLLAPQWFNSIDVDGSGHLDARELQRALALGNLNFDLTDVGARSAANGRGEGARNQPIDLSAYFTHLFQETLCQAKPCMILARADYGKLLPTSLRRSL